MLMMMTKSAMMMMMTTMTTTMMMMMMKSAVMMMITTMMPMLCDDTIRLMAHPLLHNGLAVSGEVVVFPWRHKIYQNLD